MKLNLPADPSQVTLRQFIDYKLAVDEIERLVIATGRSRETVMKLNPEAANYVISTFETVIDQTRGELKRHILIKKGVRRVRISFIPALESMTLAEHVDLDDLTRVIWKEGKYEYLVKLFTVLYRPVHKRLGKWYELIPYDSEKNAHEYFIDRLDMDTVNAALLFFSTIANELSRNSLDYLEQEAMTATKNNK